MKRFLERMESVVWEMEEALGLALEVCLDSHFALLGLDVV